MAVGQHKRCTDSSKPPLGLRLFQAVYTLTLWRVVVSHRAYHNQGSPMAVGQHKRCTDSSKPPLGLRFTYATRHIGYAWWAEAFFYQGYVRHGRDTHGVRWQGVQTVCTCVLVRKTSLRCRAQLWPCNRVVCTRATISLTVLRYLARCSVASFLYIG